MKEEVVIIMDIKNKGFIVYFWDRFFYLLSFISLFYWIRKVTKNKSYLFVEIWVVGNLLASIVISLMLFLFVRVNLIAYIFMIYALLRIFEIIVYQINVMLFHPYRAFLENREYYIKSPTRIVILLFHNYAEIIFWFSSIFISILFLSGESFDLSWGYYVKSSLLCFATLNQDSVINLTNNTLGILTSLAFVEFLAGLIMTTITLARFIGILPGVKIKEKY